MEQIRTDLLRIAAQHLLTGKLGHEVFDFSTYNKGIVDFDENPCGTNGCLIGEMPIIFPDDWKFVMADFGFHSSVSLKTFESDYAGDDTETDSAMRFFKINYMQFAHLFVPCCQQICWGHALNGSATKEQVANNVILFCDLVDKGEINYLSMGDE